MKKILYMMLGLALLTSACSKDDPAAPDNLINFSASTQGIESTSTSADVTLTLSRAADVAVPVTINLVTTGVTYGTEFTTTPAATNNAITVTVPAGSNTVSFKINKAEGLFLNGGESVTFNIATAGSPILVGATNSTKVSFAAITSDGTTLTLNGGEGGAAAVNSVFVDLSANKQTSVLRNSWDLGFYAGDDFRVIINNTTAASVIAVDKTDLTQVSESDITISNLNLGYGQGSFSIIDDVNGDLTKTAIPQVSATDAENKVYVINRVGGSATTSPAADLYKIRVLRANGGYSLQYAKLNETTFKTISIAKNSTFNFNYVSFEKGAEVEVEPTKDHWDMQWTYSIYYTGTIPYAFSDLVFTNSLGGITSAEVLTSTVSYDAYASANVATTTFTTSRNTMGSAWRATTGTVGVKTDRFYVIKDAAGNVYKLKFNSFTTQDGGTRGYPVIQYALVK
ncbi:hypothetical protein IM792_19395 [Mucilaginibacter sp. JRF]|uniref:HmuY family protein n=1 Tax=Mucilaginibacter sp. JRF TaxID=2780088 RepID=UPI00187FC384|nr:HmuY family protein [Mucilaginibacter sp. JRF]MBE9586623.1 hypothetical protein [Mucilaginibacter sp. JRF]